MQVHGDSTDGFRSEGSSLASRCCVRLIHEVVCKFDNTKRELVQSTGFGGMLYFPPMKQINRKFAHWLMSCVDEVSSSIVIGDHINLKFSKEDVATVFGIPCSGKSVLQSAISIRQAKEKVITHYLGHAFKEHRSIRVIQDLLERSYSYPMSKEEEDVFRVAFVVFVVSTLLCPSSKHDYANVDYWNAIKDPGTLSTYDWSDYVVVKLLDVVIKLKQDVSGMVKFPNITGCSIFLQVIILCRVLRYSYCCSLLFLLMIEVAEVNFFDFLF